MATITKGYTFGATETVTSAKLATLVDNATLANIVAADISSNAVTDIKINDVSGSKFTTLTAIPGSAGEIPLANIPNITGAKLTSLSGVQSGAGIIPAANLSSTLLVKIGTFTKNVADSSGNTAYTGVGFTPKVVLFFAANSASSGVPASYGFTAGAADYSVANTGTTSGNRQGGQPSCITYYDSGGNNKATYVSFDADGFTLSWTKTSSPTGTIAVIYMALG